jgi:ribA/ribD-fused uncharacterized protein
MKAKFRNHLGFLSNMYPCHIIYLGVGYPSVDHAYHLQKLPREDLRYEHFQMSPKEVKTFAKILPEPEDWDSRKLTIMHDLLVIKFQKPEMRTRLLETPDADLVEENCWHDNFWGVCLCDKCGGHGENHLGRLLQEVKHEIEYSLT